MRVARRVPERRTPRPTPPQGNAAPPAVRAPEPDAATEEEPFSALRGLVDSGSTPRLWCRASRICPTGRAEVADVTDAADVRRLFERGLAGRERLDVLVANAGRGAGADKATVAESDPAVWKDLLHTNLLGAYLCAREAIPFLARSEAAKIIMMGSGSRLRTPPRLSAYSAAKAGLWALTTTLASELKSHSIAVNEIIPGPVLKERMLTPEKLQEIEEAGGGIELPNGQWHKHPNDLAELALFLATQPRLGPTGQSFSLLRH